MIRKSTTSIDSFRYDGLMAIFLVIIKPRCNSRYLSRANNDVNPDQSLLSNRQSLNEIYKLHEVNHVSEIFKGGKCVMRDFSLKFEKRLIKNCKIFTVGPIKTSE